MNMICVKIMKFKTSFNFINKVCCVNIKKKKLIGLTIMIYNNHETREK